MRSSIGCWVVAAIGCLCRSFTNSILWCIVKATKAAIWSHPLAIFNIIGIKLSRVRGYSPISCRVVITSSQCSGNTRHSKRVCQASSRPLPLQLAHLRLSASLIWKKYVLNTPGWTLPRLCRNSSIYGLSSTTPQSCILTDVPSLLSSFQRGVLPI